MNNNDKNVDNPQSEYGPRPMAVTVKAVVLKDDSEVLLLRRSKESYNAGLWDFPGGHWEQGEKIQEALEREITDETGLEVEIGPVLRVDEFFDSKGDFPSEKVGLRYLTFYRNGEVRLNEDEHDDYEWLPIDNAIEMLGDEGFERDKKETLIEAKNYLQMQNSLLGWQRALADFENYKKRTQAANEEFRKYCLEDFVVSLLPVLDNFEMATEHIPDDDRDKPWVAGIFHIKNQLESVLRDRGIEEISSKEGDPLNERIHEVISGNVSDGNTEIRIKKVLKKGYKIGDKVIRPVGIEAE